MPLRRPEPGIGEAALGEGGRRFLTFRVDTRLYALPAEEVSEVIRLPPVARVPQSPRSLLGVANLRGSVLPLASLRALLGRAEDEAGDRADARAIVLDGAAPVALAVDRVDALVTLAARQIQTRQAELSAAPGERLRGAFHTHGDEDVARILDVQSLLDAAFTPRARQPASRQAVIRRAPAGPVAIASAARIMLVTFLVAGQEYAFDIAAVQEIISPPADIAASPRAEALVLGVAAFRDTLLPLLSLRGLLGFPASAADGAEKVIVVAVAGVLVGLVADRMRSIVSADPDSVDPTPPVLAARAGGETQIRAIARAEGGRRLISILDTAALFREDVMRRLAGAADGGRAMAAASGAGDADERQFLVFQLGTEEFALPIAAVDEVTPAPDQITRVPKAPGFLEGVINLRGEVLPVVDQRSRFDLPPFAGDRRRRRLVVVRSGRHRAGLIVDAVSEVLRTPAGTLKPPPALGGAADALLQGVVSLGEGRRLVLVLDPGELLSRAERDLLDGFDASDVAAIP